MDAQEKGREGSKLIVTKEIRQGKLCTPFRVKTYAEDEVRAEKFYKKLAGMKDVEGASADGL
jgi:hypothetical protein